MASILSRGGPSVTVAVNIDHGQFIACDPGAEVDVGSYDEEAARAHLAMWGNLGGVSVFTASHLGPTSVVVSLHDLRPSLDLDAWDHVVATGITIESGRLHLYGPEDSGTDEAVVIIDSGSNEALLCGTGFFTVDEFAARDDDTYALMLWPGSAVASRVLKDGFA